MTSFLDPVTIIPAVNSPRGGSGGGHTTFTGAVGKLTSYVRQQQEEDNWCWAAVTSSVAKHYHQSSRWSQCNIATHELCEACCGPLSSTVCNVTWTLDGPLASAGNFHSFSAGPETMAFVMSEISADRPVGCRVAWGGGGAHFLALDGWSVDPAGSFWVDIQDPFFGPTQQTMPDLTASYQSAGDAWTHTYRTYPHNVAQTAITGGGASPTSA